MTHTTKKPRANYLTTIQAYNLEVAATPITNALIKISYGVFHVGSSLTRPDWRDVDLRCIVEDQAFDNMFGKYWSPLHMLLNATISEWLSNRTGLPIDFQFQRQTDCNKEFKGLPRSAIGVRMNVEQFNA